MRVWTIQVFYEAMDDEKRFRAETVVHVSAENVGAAYREAAALFAGRSDIKLGAIIPGKHMRFP